MSLRWAIARRRGEAHWLTAALIRHVMFAMLMNASTAKAIYERDASRARHQRLRHSTGHTY
jgi:hypothetical protein